MVRRRTAALTVTALLAATPLLTACGTSHAGAAAVVGGEKITVSSLQERVDEVRTAQERSPQSAALIEATSKLAGMTLDGMLFERVIDRAAEDAGVTATRGEIQRVRATLEEQKGGPEALREELLIRNVTAPSGIDRYCRIQVLAQELAESAGADLSTEAGYNAVTERLAKAGTELDIDVNPRYGTWNTKELTLGPATVPWLKTAEPT